MTILQIIPAPADAWALYQLDERRVLSKVVCLALVENEDGSRVVRGMDMYNGAIGFVGGEDSVGIIMQSPPEDAIVSHVGNIKAKDFPQYSHRMREGR